MLAVAVNLRSNRDMLCEPYLLTITGLDVDANETNDQSGPRSRRSRKSPGGRYINYTVGKLEILKLRDDYRAKMGDKFSLIDFHDRLLAAGLAPLKIIRREMMGADGPVL